MQQGRLSSFVNHSQHNTRLHDAAFPKTPVASGDRVTRPALLLLFLVAFRLTPCCLPCSTQGHAEVAQGPGGSSLPVINVKA